LRYNKIALIHILAKELIRAEILRTPQPVKGWAFSFSNSNTFSNCSNDLTYNSYSHKIPNSIDYNCVFSNSGSDTYIYTAPAHSFDISDYKFANVRKRKIKHSHRIAFLMKKYNIQSVSMLTLTVVFDGSYKSARQYDVALNRIRRVFSYYGISKITGSEFTEKGVKHYHIIFDTKDIIKICSSSSFRRFVKTYKLTDNDLKAIKSRKRSYLEIYIARWFFKKWRLGFCDLELQSKALYVIKYVNETYDGSLSFHGRVSYSKEFASWFKQFTSVVVCGFNNSVLRSVPNFQIPLFFIPALTKINKHKYFERLRAEFSHSIYKSTFEKYKYYLDKINFPDFYNAVERLGLTEY
jgi:hypothetical protein